MSIISIQARNHAYILFNWIASDNKVDNMDGQHPGIDDFASDKTVHLVRLRCALPDNGFPREQIMYMCLNSINQIHTNRLDNMITHYFNCQQKKKALFHFQFHEV